MHFIQSILNIIVNDALNVGKEGGIITIFVIDVGIKDKRRRDNESKFKKY